MQTRLELKTGPFEGNIKAVQNRVLTGTAGIIKQQAEMIMEESIRQCPTVTGALVSTAYVHEAREGIVTTVSFGYSGRAQNPVSGASVGSYIIKQHEDLSLYHPTGKAKFLEDPLYQFGRGMNSTLARRIRKIFI